MIAIKNKSTTGAMERPLRKWYGLTMPAFRAILASVGGIHSDELSTSIFSFVCKTRYELSPRCISEAFCETVIMHHVIDTEVFNCYYTEAVDDRPTQLVRKIGPPISDTFVNMRNDFLRLDSLHSSLLKLAHLPLGLGKRFLVCPKKPWIGDLFSSRQSSEGCKTNINTHSLIGFGKCYRFRFAREAGIPLICGTSADSEGFNITSDRSMELDLNVTDLRQPEPAINEGKSPLRISETVVSIGTTKSRIARCFACLGAPKESLKSKVDSNGDVLKDLAMDCIQGRPLLLQLRQCSLLFIQRNRLLISFPKILALLKKVVIQPAAFLKGMLHRSLLTERRIQPIFKTSLTHKNILAQVDMDYKRGERASFTPVLKDWVF